MASKKRATKASKVSVVRSKGIHISVVTKDGNFTIRTDNYDVDGEEPKLEIEAPCGEINELTVEDAKAIAQAIVDNIK